MFVSITSLIFLLSNLVFFLPVLSCLVEMDLDPLTLIILLDLNGKLLKPFELLELPDVGLELLFAAIVKDACDDCLKDLCKLVPKHAHHYQHNQVEQGKLQDDEEKVEHE